MRAARDGKAQMEERVITGRHVLLGMIAFFGVIFAVNGVFLYESLSTYTGVVSREPYRKGLNYNERIEAEKEQQALGWVSDIALAGTGDGLEIVINDHNGNPIGGLSFDGRLGRPATEELDVALDVKETAPGRYRATFTTLAPGAWQVDLAARQLTGAGDKIIWRARKRLRWHNPTAAK
jgi:nitrogen fixation protein FixH